MAEESHLAELARLAHASFEDRRRYEWRINFSLWGALGAVGYWASKEHIRVFDSRCEAYSFGVVLALLYILSLILIANGHHQDKQWKHYYMKRALGENAQEPGKPLVDKVASHVLWCVSQGGFTAAIIYLVVQVLLGVNPGAGGSK